MNQRLHDLIEANPAIAVIRDMEDFDACCKRDKIRVVFILLGDICNTSVIVGQIKESDRVAMIHIGLIIRLSSREIAVDLIRNNTGADRIISAKPALIKWAKELFLYTTLRVFVLDSMAFENIEKQVDVARPDIIEILPGLMPKAICRICRLVKVPIIAEGLVSDKEDVTAALSAGTIFVLTTNQKVWLMQISKLKSALLGKENGFMYR